MWGRIGVVVDRRNNVSSAAVSLDPPDFAFEEAARLEVDLAHLPSSDAVPSSEHAHVRDVREEGR